MFLEWLGNKPMNQSLSIVPNLHNHCWQREQKKRTQNIYSTTSRLYKIVAERVAVSAGADVSKTFKGASRWETLARQIDDSPRYVYCKHQVL